MAIKYLKLRGCNWLPYLGQNVLMLKREFFLKYFNICLTGILASFPYIAPHQVRVLFYLICYMSLCRSLHLLFMNGAIDWVSEPKHGEDKYQWSWMENVQP